MSKLDTGIQIRCMTGSGSRCLAFNLRDSSPDLLEAEPDASELSAIICESY